MRPVPESNGWPFEIPDRPWVPTLRLVDLVPGDWIRHGIIIPHPERFWQVSGVHIAGSWTDIGFVTQPRIPAKDQPHHLVLRTSECVEVRLLWPAEVRLSTSATIREIGPG